jgi:hypothetical protein
VGADVVGTSSNCCGEAVVGGAVVTGTVAAPLVVTGTVVTGTVATEFDVPTLFCTASPAPSPMNAAALNTAVFWRAPRAGCRRRGVGLFITVPSLGFVRKPRREAPQETRKNLRTGSYQVLTRPS